MRTVVHPDADVLAAAAAARVITDLADAQAARGTASLVLAGGGVAIATLEQLRLSSARDAVNWGNVDVYWGDERFVPTADADRNELQAREALLDHVPVDPARVHPLPASDGELDLDAAAAAYAEALPERFDVLLLGMGPDGHTASLFPGDPAVESTKAVEAVRDSPKPPPRRLTLTLPTINRATKIYVLAAGDAKAEPVARAQHKSTMDIPVGGVGDHALWLLDASAASAISAG